MVGSARRETQREYRIIPEGKCDGGGVGEADGRKIECCIEIMIKEHVFRFTSNPQAISMAVKSLNTMHHDSMSVNFVRFGHTFPLPHNAT